MTTLRTALQLLPLVPYFLSLLLLPFLVRTRFFIPMVFTLRLLLFCPFLLHLGFLERNLETSNFVREHIHGAYKETYKFIAVSSAFLITVQSVMAIKNSQDSGLSSASSRILRAINDDPAVSALGYDYVLSAASFVTWYMI